MNVTVNIIGWALALIILYLLYKNITETTDGINKKMEAFKFLEK